MSATRRPEGASVPPGGRLPDKLRRLWHRLVPIGGNRGPTASRHAGEGGASPAPEAARRHGLRSGRKRLKAIALTAGFSLAALLALDLAFPLPPPGRDTARAVVVTARDGTPLRAFPDGDHVWRHPVTLDEVSPRYIEALLAYEDKAFYWHPGVNPWALLRAAWQWAIHGRPLSGGSTLTMQVARILEPVPRTIPGKLRQIVRALQLELHYSKDEILTLYLNYAPMGGVLEGVEAASRGYLGKPARRLSHAEAALLAVIPQAPSRLRPDRHPEAARAARDKVLRRMAPVWGEATVADALQEPAYALVPRPPLLAPLLAQRLRAGASGGRVVSTIDAAAQHSVELLLADRIASLPPRVSMAALVVDNATLEVRAYAGSADFTDDRRFSHVDMVQAVRSPGSTLKPFLYALALDEGLIHSESLLGDVPQDFHGYQPGNFQQSFHGPVSVSEALALSLNVPAVEVLDRLDPARFVALLRRGGLRLDLPAGATPNLSVILGGGGTSLESLVGAYTAFARGGIAGKPRYRSDAPLEEARMMSAGAAFIIRDVLESGGPVGRALESGPGVRRGLAWKTGTSFGFRDAWAVGVSDRHTIGVWVGRPDGTPNPGFFGANIAAPLVVNIFDAIDGAPPAPRVPPTGVEAVSVCWPLGTRYNPEERALCHQRRTAWTLDGATPPTFPDRLRGGEPRYTYLVDEQGRRVTPACGSGTTVAAARWPAALEPWLDGSLRRQALPPAWAPGCSDADAPEAGLRIAGVSDGEVVRRTASGAAPLVSLRARGPRGRVHWLVNGRRVAHLPADAALVQRFEQPGSYRITAMDDHGRYDRITLSVR